MNNPDRASLDRRADLRGVIHAERFDIGAAEEIGPRQVTNPEAGYWPWRPDDSSRSLIRYTTMVLGDDDGGH